MQLTVIGGGLAGSEAAYQAAERGVRVRLYEMRPLKLTPAHKTGDLAELVCSNSLKSTELTTAQGLLKEEMRRLGSLILTVAQETRVPGGKALCVDRELFGRRVTEVLETHPNISILREEVAQLPSQGVVIVASGPLTSPPLSEQMELLVGSEHLHFYDAISPIVSADSLKYGKLFFASRYGVDKAYLNSPLEAEEYRRLRREILSAQILPPHGFEEKFFEGCLPVEELARRGEDTLRFSVLKPVGLTDPRTKKRPYAVCQLRKENLQGSGYSMVGFQTRMKWGEQRRVFRMLPGLEKAEFLRHGSAHRNTYLNSPKVLSQTLQTRAQPGVLIAGQLTGVEGYVESTAVGLLAGMNGARLLQDKEPVVPPKTTVLGSLVNYVTTSDSPDFQPMNANFGLLPPVDHPKRDRKSKLVESSLRDLNNWMENL